RFSRDWSSDVCSSDLTGVHVLLDRALDGDRLRRGVAIDRSEMGAIPASAVPGHAVAHHVELVDKAGDGHVMRGSIFVIRVQERRSEERRVGKEGRTRW